MLTETRSLRKQRHTPSACTPLENSGCARRFRASFLIWITVYYGLWPHMWTHMFSIYRVAESHWTAFSATRMLTRKHVLDQNIIKNVVCHPMVSITLIWKLHLIFTGCFFIKMCHASWMAYSLYGNHILFCIYPSTYHCNAIWDHMFTMVLSQ